MVPGHCALTRGVRKIVLNARLWAVNCEGSDWILLLAPLPSLSQIPFLFSTLPALSKLFSSFSFSTREPPPAKISRERGRKLFVLKQFQHVTIGTRLLYYLASGTKKQIGTDIMVLKASASPYVVLHLYRAQTVTGNFKLPYERSFIDTTMTANPVPGALNPPVQIHQYKTKFCKLKRFTIRPSQQPQHREAVQLFPWSKLRSQRSTARDLTEADKTMRRAGAPEVEADWCQVSNVPTKMLVML
eukprot:2045071-Rhodomonas_salina.2